MITTWYVGICCRCNIVRQLSEHYRNVLCSASDIAKIRRPAWCHKHRVIWFLKVLQYCFLRRTGTIKTLWHDWGHSTQTYFLRSFFYAIFCLLQDTLPSSPDMRVFLVPQEKVHSVLFAVFMCIRVTLNSTMDTTYIKKRFAQVFILWISVPAPWKMPVNALSRYSQNL